MPTQDEIRKRFRSWLGDERYRNFVYRVPSSAEGTRLLFWQEREWERFVEENPDCQLDFAGIVDVFANCPEFGAFVRRTAYCELVKSWLHGDSMSVDELERQLGSNRTENRQQLESFGLGSKQWQRIKEQLQPGDKLYKFRSPPETWANMAGRAGIALVRDDKVIDTLVTALN
ncbi:hypothetical protein Q31b_58140 [Novipirellula aureliae]|uniref:Uncharacterized protein n=1 Tax=Novipirellula aureliae TaxID=2527966 RepID=A0A5C6DAF9_9BACT|nr:hypothetical protein [Novipirellula aureliae]TWU32771.1 hypothetical protein Q31b_58140 [Novipirellula aureliae]